MQHTNGVSFLFPFSHLLQETTSLLSFILPSAKWRYREAALISSLLRCNLMGKCQGSESIQKKCCVSSVHCSCLRHWDRGASSSPPADLLHCLQRNGGKQHTSKIQLETNLSLSSLCKVRQVLISCRKGFCLRLYFTRNKFLTHQLHTAATSWYTFEFDPKKCSLTDQHSSAHQGNCVQTQRIISNTSYVEFPLLHDILLLMGQLMNQAHGISLLSPTRPVKGVSAAS